MFKRCQVVMFYSGIAGNMSTKRLKTFPRRGDSPLEGVGSDTKSATYFWHPVSRTPSVGKNLEMLTIRL